MAYINKLLLTGRVYQLIKSKNTNGSTKYLINIRYNWGTNGGWHKFDEFVSFIDSQDSRGITGMDYAWKFNTRREAEELLSLAILKELLPT